MPSPTDHFRAFVDRLRSDDPDPSTARVARAVAGESWARFGDRIVLERAAYLVTTTDRTLGDIADECGFRGYEVFTRAFRREYGALPSEWRRDPTSWLIDAPGEVHVHSAGGLRLPARDRRDSVDLVVSMVEHHVRDVGDLLARAVLVADGRLDHRDDADEHTLRSALTALVDRMELFTALVHDLPGPTTHQHETLDALRRRWEHIGPDHVAAVALVGATGRFDEAVVDAFSPDPTVRSFGDLVTAAVTDADGLRLVAATRLRACGVVSRPSSTPATKTGESARHPAARGLHDVP